MTAKSKRKPKIIKIPEAPRKKGLGATWTRPGKSGARIRKTGGAVKRKTGGTIRRKTGGRTSRK